MSTRRPKSKNKHAGDAQAFEDAVMADPYVAISSPLTVCSSEGNLFLAFYLKCRYFLYVFLVQTILNVKTALETRGVSMGLENEMEFGNKTVLN